MSYLHDPIHAIYDECARQTISGITDAGSRSKQIARLLGDARRVLDVGCGYGLNASSLATLGHEVVGIDVSPIFVEACRSRGVEAYVCNIETEPLPDFGHFDAVVMTEVLEHLIDPYRVLREKVVSLLRNDGTLVASVPNCAFLKERLSLLRGLPPTFREGPKDRDSDRYRPYNLYHKTAFTVASFVETLSIAGFEVLFIEQTEGYIPSSMAKPGVQQLWRVLGCMRPNLFLNQVIAKARRRAF